MTELEDQIRREVAAHGFHVVIIRADGDDPGYAFTLGLASNHGHPELCCFGLDEGEQGGPLHEFLDAAARMVVEGSRFEAGTQVPGLVERFDIAVREVIPGRRDEWLGFGVRFHKNRGFDCVQLVWPDATGRFPWESDCDPQAAAVQPLLDR